MGRTKQTPRDTTTSKPLPIATPLSPLPPNTQPLLRQGPQAVAYHIPTTPPSTTHPLPKTTLSLPRNSTWTSGLHFHTSHTEYLHLLRGSIFMHLNGSLRIYSASAGGEVHCVTGALVKEGLAIEVPRYARHDWGRAEEGAWKTQVFMCAPQRITRPADVEDEVVVEEWTEPGDMGKALFFWNLNGVVNAPDDARVTGLQGLVKSVLGDWWVPFQLFVVFWELDNWPVFWDLGYQDSPGIGGRYWVHVYRWMEYLMTFGVLFAAKVLGWLVGVRAVEEGRTPDALWKAYQARGV